MKELRFHPQYRTLLITTAEDSFNVFRPNLDPEDEEEDTQDTASNKQMEESKKSDKKERKRTDYAVDSDEDNEKEEKRIMETAKQLNKQRNARSKSK
jgi:hypothetical protein